MNKNAREQGVHLDLNRPYSGEEEELRLGVGMGVHRGEERGVLRRESSRHARLTMEQCKQLDEFYRQNPTIDVKQKRELAARLNLRLKQVDSWIRNRRSRSKQKSTEMECKQLKESLNIAQEDNHSLRLQVEQLKTKNLQLQLQLHTHHWQHAVRAPAGQQASTSAATGIFTSPWLDPNPYRAWYSPNAL
uniref:Homeobox domain-containing protein n=1 Tax=Oryza brachyantha TaxID=4533 RepID=J3MA11_ORYBR